MFTSFSSGLVHTPSACVCALMSVMYSLDFFFREENKFLKK